MRWKTLATGLVFGVISFGPASANTIATFELSNVTLYDRLNPAVVSDLTGTFALDLTARKITNVAITAESAGPHTAESYAGSPVDEFGGTHNQSNSLWNLKFHQDVSAGGSILELDLLVVAENRLLSIPPLVLGGDQLEYSIFCSAAGGLCAARYISGGQITTLSVAQTPIPATLPLLMTALGGLGLARRRLKSATR